MIRGSRGLLDSASWRVERLPTGWISWQTTIYACRFTCPKVRHVDVDDVADDLCFPGQRISHLVGCSSDLFGSKELAPPSSRCRAI